jgi:hypothetical protein
MSTGAHERRINSERRVARRRDVDFEKSSSTSPPTQGTHDGLTSLALDRLWTVHQAAAFLGRSTSWVYKAAESGALPRAKGLAWGLRFLPADLIAYARGDSHAPAVPGRREGT